MKIKFYYIFFAFFYLGNIISLYSQVVYEPINSPVYNFLDEIAIQKTIRLEFESKPFSRKYIAEKLIEIEKRSNILNDLQRQELIWYSKEFRYEIDILLKKDSDLSAYEDSYFIIPNNSQKERIRLASYESDSFMLKLSPLFAYGINKFGNESGNIRAIGIRTFGTIGKVFGASFHFSDNGQFGNTVDYKKDISRERVADFLFRNDGIEFSDFRVQLNFNWNWGTISLKKDYLEWGSGYYGNVILSAKAPSFPHIYFELKPTDWFRFRYIFGWLHSGIVDSSRSYINYPNSVEPREYNYWIKKYFVANLLTFRVTDWFDFSFGNSFVYAGDFRPEMMIPFNFFKYMDRDTGKKSIEDGNGALHFNFNFILPYSLRIYLSSFVDVTSIKGLIDSDYYDETWIAYTVGVRKTNLFINNLTLTAEYTKVNKWNYEHKYETTTYKHLNFVLGYWSGQNSDDLRIQIDYSFFRGLLISAFVEYMRKGGLEDIAYAYDFEKDSELEFLYSPLRTDKILGFAVNYEPIHELYLKFNYKYSSINDEDPTRTNDILLGSKNWISFELAYGIR